MAQGEFVATVDSDTRLDSRAIDRALVQFSDPEVGGVTGVALVDNRDTLLTRLIHLRYWNAFCQERASQSYVGVVTCCSGVFSVYRRAFVQSVAERYVSQSFLGKPCHYGDDRHLTNLLLCEGLEVRVALDALAWTQAPTRLLTWVRQQRRWSQSFYREFLWSLRFAHRRNFYFAYCLFFQAALPLLLVYGLARGGVSLALGDWTVAFRYVAAVVLMALLRGAYGIYRTREPDFALMPIYGFLHLFLIIPVRLLALFTLWDNRWGTR
ncbi:MAG: glycosyltransferase [Armatimonadetes bacterium]|nr:glycosyltransferase [Armatimonadota bacterium]